MSERRRLGSAKQFGYKKAIIEKENVNDMHKCSKILAGSNYNGVIRARHLSVDLDDLKSHAADDKRAPLQLYLNNAKSNVVSSTRDQAATRFTRKCEFFENFTNSRRMYLKEIPPPKASSTQQFEADAGQSSKKLNQKSNKSIVRDSAPISGKGYIDFGLKIPGSCLCSKRMVPSNFTKHTSVQTERSAPSSSTSSLLSANRKMTSVEPTPVKKIYLTDRSLSPKSRTENKSKFDGNSCPPPSHSSSIFARTNNSTKLSNDTTCKLWNGSRIAPEKLNPITRITVKRRRNNEMARSNENLSRLTSSCGAPKYRFRSRSANCRLFSVGSAIATNNKCKSRNLQSSASASHEEKRATDKVEKKVQGGKEEGRNFDLPPTLVYNVTYMSDLISVERDRDRRSMEEFSLDFLMAKSVDSKLRESAIAFLICVSMECRYSPPILYQAVKIFDRSIGHFSVDFDEVKIVALSALWISLKKDVLCHKIPSAKSLTTFYDDKSETVEKLLNYERRILVKLDFNLTFSDPFSVLIYYLVTCNTRLSQCDQTITKVYYCGGYMIDLALLDANFIHVPAFVLALVTAEIALCIVVDPENSPSYPQWNVWRQKCICGVQKELISSGFYEKDLDEMRTTILKKISMSTRSTSNGEVVYAKYTRSRYGGVANFLVEKVDKITKKQRLVL